MSDESEHSESEFYYPEMLTDMELLQLPTDVQREDKKSSAKLLTGEEVHNFIRCFIFFQNDVTEFHLPCLVSGAVAEVESEQKPHRARKHFGIMDAELIFFKDALDIFVCQG